MVQKFDKLVEGGYPWKLRDIMPKVLVAGEDAGILTEEGAKKLDPTGNLKAGIPLCPPEGDAGTGMVATNSVAQRTGNVPQVLLYSLWSSWRKHFPKIQRD